MLSHIRKTKHIASSGQSFNECIPLTGMDLVLSDSYVNHVFVYPETLDVDALLNALNKALCVYPQFAGRVYKNAHGKPVLHCNDAGLPVTIINSKMRLADLDPNDPINPIYKKVTTHTLPNATLDRSGPPAAVKLTQLKDGGSILAFAHSHIIADAASAFDILHTWADILHDKDVALKPKPHKRSEFTELYKGLDKTKKSNLEPFGLVGVAFGLKIVGILHRAKRRNKTKTFRYSAEELKACKQLATEQIRSLPGQEHAWISTQDALTALVWKEIAFSRDNDAISKLNNVINFRERNDIPLPTDYVGNAVAMRAVPENLWSMANIRSASLGELSLAIRHLFPQINKESVSQDLAYLDGLLDQRKQEALVGLGLDIIKGSTTFNNWTCFKGYDINFGSDPVWYNPVLWPWSNFIHFVSAPNDSVIAQIQLPKKEMTVFSQRHQENLYSSYAGKKSNMNKS